MPIQGFGGQILYSRIDFLMLIHGQYIRLFVYLDEKKTLHSNSILTLVCSFQINYLNINHCIMENKTKRISPRKKSRPEMDKRPINL